MKRAKNVPINNLRKYRLVQGYEQKEVAFLLGLKSHSAISEWETGITKPGLDNLLQLSIIYRTLPDELYYDLRQEYVLELNRRMKELEARRDEGS